ncbi:MAG: response regulator [Rhodospirillales bacterium]|nr:response regulator [Rhodospirillales bacterium]
MAHTIFIVDDDPDMIEIMTLILESHGHRVGSSLAGTDAIPKIAAQKPDCVLTDLMMAELDGLHLCAELRARKDLGNMTIIVVSARDHPYWQERAREFGADGYIVKPLDPKTFAATVEDFIGGGGTA